MVNLEIGVKAFKTCKLIIAGAGQTLIIYKFLFFFNDFQNNRVYVKNRFRVLFLPDIPKKTTMVNQFTRSWAITVPKIRIKKLP